MALAEEHARRLREIAQAHLSADNSCHDWDHTRRVLETALAIGAEEGADLAVLEAAAILHDIARPEEMADQGRTDHAERGAELARGILAAEAIGAPAFREHVAQCIRTHRWRSRSGDAPATLEAKILFDADKLDSLGAIGVGRSFHFAGQTGARVHNTAEEALAGESYGREDSAYREFLVKIQYLPARMLTPAGRRLAAQRLQFMRAFFDELNRECYPQ